MACSGRQGFAGYISSVINALLIQFMNFVYTKISITLTNWGAA